MKKSYILVYSDSLGTREEVKKCLDELDEVITWRFDMPNSFYIISNHSAKEIGRAIRSHLKSGRFIITEISKDNRNGWLPTDSWHLINFKSHKKKSN